jgi:hypothetical protein
MTFFTYKYLWPQTTKFSRHETLGDCVPCDDVTLRREEDCFHLVKRDISFIHSLTKKYKRSGKKMNHVTSQKTELSSRLIHLCAAGISIRSHQSRTFPHHFLQERNGGLHTHTIPTVNLSQFTEL